MTIAHAHKLLDQELLTVPEALLGSASRCATGVGFAGRRRRCRDSDGSTLFSSEWFSAARSGTSERKQTQRFVGSVRAEAPVGPHVERQRNGVRCSPQVSPDNFQRRSPDRHTDPMTEWLTNFGGQGEPTLAGHVFDMSSEVTVIISAHEADP
ncbi:BZ3500_MvSof-1268-A1-R1_Chr10-3g03058 [Microbotryum saponariae]|uniref:BZ3500_MvSof-1268-A1-R1_Chr10-3g03058 protein n=1 Tax=Microbotryum saponariae TaxID=289078 RepID=A0A2X0LZH1_9BASI|nr:BZ3500_MvSof-1268-A1-R1_Chr10-3g03058 [Microbotryum saponariae]